MDKSKVARFLLAYGVSINHSPKRQHLTIIKHTKPNYNIKHHKTYK